jgi:hypothetical protein
MSVRAGFAAAVVLALAACATSEETQEPEQTIAAAPETPQPQTPAAKPAEAPPERTAPAPAAKPATEVDVLLDEFERMRRMSLPELQREHELARLAFAQTRSDASRVRLAMIASMQPSAPGEETRAIELLDPLVKTPGATLHGLAFLLSSYIQEQRRLAVTAQGLQQNMQGLQQSNQSLQQNVHALQQKLDALRTLERALSERGETGLRRR